MERRHFHVWFSTKGRKHVLEGDIEVRIKELFREVASEKGILVEDIETVWDHVHLLLTLTPDQSVPWALKHLKGRVAYEVQGGPATEVGHALKLPLAEELRFA